MLSRRSHREEGFALRGSAVRAYTPYNPVPRDETWYFFLVEQNSNAVWTWTKVGAGCCQRINNAGSLLGRMAGWVAYWGWRLARYRCFYVFGGTELHTRLWRCVMCPFVEVEQVNGVSRLD
jgi:hypothetical protein